MINNKLFFPFTNSTYCKIHVKMKCFQQGKQHPGAVFRPPLGFWAKKVLKKTLERPIFLCSQYHICSLICFMCKLYFIASAAQFLTGIWKAFWGPKIKFDIFTLHLCHKKGFQGQVKYKRFSSAEIKDWKRIIRFPRELCIWTDHTKMQTSAMKTFFVPHCAQH